MKDYLDLATTTPNDEDCAQVGREEYTKWARIEALAYREQLEREYGPPPGESYIRIVSQNHDFGSYLELRVYYDSDNPLEVDFAFNCENGSENWDKIAIKQLKKKDYPFKFITDTPFPRGGF